MGCRPSSPGQVRQLGSYARTALQGEADRVRVAPVGARTHALNKAGYHLGQLIAAGALDEDTAERELLRGSQRALCRGPAGHARRSAGLHPRRHRRGQTPPTRPHRNCRMNPPAAAMTADPLPDEPRSELGYARRLVHAYGDRLRYVAAWRRWLVWDGKRWAIDGTGQAGPVDEIGRPAAHLRRAGADRRQGTCRRAQPGPPRRIRRRGLRRAHPSQHRGGHRGHPR